MAALWIKHLAFGLKRGAYSGYGVAKMRKTGWALVAYAVLGVPAFGQSATPCVVGSMSYTAVGLGTSRSGTAFSSMVKTTFEQKLPEGNSIHTEYITHQARDTKGRTRQEYAQGCHRGEDGQPRLMLHVTIHDPEAKQTVSWFEGGPEQSGPKVATVFYFPSPGPSSAAGQSRVSRPVTYEERGSTRSENLGTRIFAGIPAEGTRTVRIIAAGAEGNTLPLELVTETWFALDAGIMMMHVQDDPRRGRTTTEVIELTRGEPDLALFAPPADYTIKEQGIN